MITILRFCPLSRYFGLGRNELVGKVPKRVDAQIELFLLSRVWSGRRGLPEIQEQESEYQGSQCDIQELAQDEDQIRAAAICGFDAESVQ